MFSHPRLSWSLVLLVFLLGAIFSARAASVSPHVAAPREGGKTLHILAVGISKYQHYKVGEIPRFADKDAIDFTSSLESVARGNFDQITTHLLVNEKATRAAIALAAEEVMSNAKPQDTFVVFFSGHGKTRTIGPKKEEQFYLLPTDFNPALGNGELYDKGISGGLLQSWFLKIQSQHQFIVLDSSKSGRGFEGFISRAEEDNKFLGSMVRRDFAMIFIKGVSFEFSTLKNGLLTYVLLEGLKGGAASDGGVVTVRTLIDYVERESPAVRRRAANTTARRLITKFSTAGLPSSYYSGRDFPLGSKPGSPPVVSADLRQWAQPAFMKTVNALGAHSDVRLAAVPHSSQVAARPPGLGQATEAASPRPQEGDDPVFMLKPECAPLSEFHPSTSTHRKGKDHALLFGIDNYDNDRWTPLNNPVFDATSIAEVLNTRFGFETEVVKNPTRACVSDYLTKYSTKKYGDDEQLLIFFAGHGVYKSNSGGALIARDSDFIDPNNITAIHHNLLTLIVNNHPCKHVFLVLDSCFGGSMVTNRGDQTLGGTSGAVASSDLTAADSIEDRVTTLMQFRTRRFLTSGGLEYVSDGAPGRHSPFTNKLLSSFQMENLRDRPFITLTEIIPKVKFADPFRPVILYADWITNDSRSEFFFFPTPASEVQGMEE